MINRMFYREAFAYFGLIIIFARAHRQCLDGKPPFTASPPLQFCEEYQSTGCCTAIEDRQIQSRYLHIARSVESLSCQSHIKALLCQQCSPYAAHLYSFEETGIASPLPGLCSSYCSMVYESCGAEILQLLTNDETYASALRSKDSFCEYSKLSDQDYCYPELKTNPVLTERFISQQIHDSQGCMCLQKVASGHGLVTFIEMNPDVEDMMYVGEQIGLVHVYHKGVKKRRPFFDLSRDVLLSNSRGDERGLLGMVLHPKFSKNRRFFVYYVINLPGGQTVRISQWSARNNVVARRGSEKILLDLPQPFVNHNGGQLLFGDDGFLYIFTGDGGSGGDPLYHGQNLQTLLGKVLRINVDKKRRGNYTIPSDNPFRGQGRSEIYAYGLRNPWKCSKDAGDPRTGKDKGRIFCADVGQNKYEEIDIIVRGGNYGWASREGFECFESSLHPNSCGKIGKEQLPIHAYNHSIGKSVTGGYVYRGCEYPELDGSYIYGDFTSGRMFRLEEKNNKWHNKEISMCSPSVCTGNWVSTYGKGITTFGTNSQGDILMASTEDEKADSSASMVYKLIMQPFRRSDPSSCTVFVTNSTSKPLDISSVVVISDTQLSQPLTTSLLEENESDDTTGPPYSFAPTSKSLFDTEEYVVLPEIYHKRQRQIADLIAKYENLIRQLQEELENQASAGSTTTPTSPGSTQYSSTNSPSTAVSRSISSQFVWPITYSWERSPLTSSTNQAVTSSTKQAVTSSTNQAVTLWPPYPVTRRTYFWQRTTPSPSTSRYTTKELRIIRSMDRKTAKTRVYGGTTNSWQWPQSNYAYSWRRISLPRATLPPLTTQRSPTTEKFNAVLRRLTKTGRSSRSTRATRKSYSWQMTTPLGFVTSFQLPEYLRSKDENIYKPLDRPYVANNRYTLPNYWNTRNRQYTQNSLHQ